MELGQQAVHGIRCEKISIGEARGLVNAGKESCHDDVQRGQRSSSTHQEACRLARREAENYAKKSRRKRHVSHRRNATRNVSHCA